MNKDLLRTSVLWCCHKSAACLLLVLSCLVSNFARANDKKPLAVDQDTPVFSSPAYNFSLADNASLNTPVGSVSASDADGDSVTYKLVSGNTNGAFAIDSITGSVRLAKALNYHAQSSYTLSVSASDPGGLYGLASVSIAVTPATTAPSFDIISWGTSANQPYPVSEVQGLVVKGKLYTFSGFDSEKSFFTPTSRAYVYDPVANTWTPIASMPAMNGTSYGGVTHAGFATDGTDIYFAGGYTSNGNGTGQIFGTKEVWRYVVAEDRYERLPNLPVTISCGRLEYVGGKLYHIGGANGSRTIDLDFTYALDLDNLNAGWKKLASLPSPRQHAGSAVYGGKIYYIGGQKGHDDTLVTKKDVHRYDPITNTWTQVADLPVPAGANGRSHIASAVTVIGNQIIVMGGEIRHEVPTNMVSSYNPATDTWTNLTPLPANRSSGVAANLGNKLYYSGGSEQKTTYKGLLGVQQLINFTLINADTDQPIQTLSNGATLNIGTLPTRNLAIRANTNFTSGSVKFNLTGAETKTISDNSVPFTLTGDTGSDYLAWTPTAGSYILKGTPYTGPDGTGTASTAVSIKFTVIDQPQQVISYSLINADTDLPIASFSRDTTINLADLPTRNLNIKANTNPDVVGSVSLNVNGSETKSFVDNASPYALFEDNRGDFYDWTPAVGSYTLKATPYTAAKAAGTIGIPLTVQLNVIDQPQQQVTGFTIINADADTAIQELTNGSIINLAGLPTQNLNIRANTNPENVDSVVFNLTGAETRKVTERVAPYALFADNNGDYPSWTPTPGYYTLKATPYITINGVATAGPSYAISFSVTESAQATDVSISPVADAYVRDGSYANTNYGFDTTLQVKGTTFVGYARQAFLKFPLNKLGDVTSAKLRIYGRNAEGNSAIVASLYGLENDNWTETCITWNNAPSSPATALGSISVNNQRGYYEIDVTDFAKAQFAKDKVATFLLKDTAAKNKQLTFNSRENLFFPPQLVVTTSVTAPASNSMLFVENLDKFPSNTDFAASRVQVPWSRDKVVYNTDHDTLRIRVHNKGINPLIVNNLSLSNKVAWKIVSLKGIAYDSAVSMPLTIAPGTYADVLVRFIPKDSAVRVRILSDEFSIVSNDDKEPIKTLYLHGLFQREGEGSKEPKAQELISAFGFKTRTGFNGNDPDKGASNKPKGDEVLTSYFVRVDTTRPVTVRQMAAYHGCCNIQPESLRWYPKGNSGSLSTAAFHIMQDAQSLLPRRSSSNTTYLAAEGNFSPATAFGFKVGGQDWTDTLLNSGRKIGIRVWKAIDPKGQVIPNAYIISNDYLGTSATNYDYNDNMYYITNVRPEFGPASASALMATPSAVDFGEQFLQSTSNFSLNLKSLGQQYASGISDPAITITAVSVVGQNASEFTAAMPASTTLSAQQSTTLALGFNPVSEGLKIADLLIYYNNATSPLRVPLYGIAKASTTTVTVPYRVKSGSSTEVVVNGKTWTSDKPYAYDNLEPFANAELTQVSATDEDSVYLREQSSNGDKKPFRYEMPLKNGTYWVRLHFAEIYWGNPGSGFNGGPGSRVMSVSIEDELKLINLDVAGEVGSASTLIKNIPVNVTDGKLNIDFSATVNRPMICAVEVYKFSPPEFIADRHLPTETVIAKTEVAKTRVYPNPVHQRFAIAFPSSFKGNVVLQLADATGRVYELGRTSVQEGGTIMEVDLSNRKLAPGAYFLRLVGQNNHAEVIKLLIQ